jgi:glyoxylase-like metal-dependent hydrolase (beta-lactamase superfamily II)
VVAPNLGLNGNEILNLDGVVLRFHHTGKAHTDHDLMIEVMEDKTIFLGDVVAAEHVPSSDVPRDAYFKGQINAIRTILKQPIDIHIPGHGRTGGREVSQASLDFLERLYDSVTKYYKQGLHDFEMKEYVVKELYRYRDWFNFGELGRVISHVFLEIEAESF